MRTTHLPFGRVVVVLVVVLVAFYFVVERGPFAVPGFIVVLIVLAAIIGPLVGVDPATELPSWIRRWLSFGSSVGMVDTGDSKKDAGSSNEDVAD